MKHRVIIEAQAASDIREAARWIAEQGAPLNAARWIDGIESAIDSLASMPERCPLAPESAAFDLAIRQLMFGSHRILFVAKSGLVHVLHVRHGARLPWLPK
ncbi:MAG: type II toxin-antitoxin system RelE/ParE family toxin [Phycisphaerales bacterium]